MRRENFAVLAIILLIGTLTQVSTDIYLPSMPAIGLFFNVPIGEVQLTMTLLILGVAISGLAYGGLADVIGRRPTLILGLTITLVGALICFFASSITWLQIGRLVQGLGLGACSALWRSIFRDTYSGDELAQVGSYLANVILLSVILAPFIGGYIEHYGQWYYTFMLLIGWTILVMLVVLMNYQEPEKSAEKSPVSMKYVMRTYGELLRNKKFMAYTTSSFLSYGGLFAWLTAGPVILIKSAGVSPMMFGWLSFITGGAMALAGTVNGKLVKQYGSQTMMYWGWGLMALAGLLMLICSVIWSTSVWIVLGSGLIFIFGSTLTFANAFANAFEDIGHIAGFGGGLYSGIQLLGGAFFSAILSHLSTTSPQPLAMSFIASGLFAWLVIQMHCSGRAFFK